MGVILLLICVSMVVTLVPGLMSGQADTSSAGSIATVAGQPITIEDFQRQYNQVTRSQQIPPMMRGIYARQLLNDMIFQRALDYEAARLGMQITPEEEAERIKEILPSAWSGNTWLKDRYANEVQQATGMTVEQFESELRDEMLSEKFREIVTDGVSVSPAEIEQEFRWRNEKVKIEYALLKPADLAASIHPSDAELAAWFARNSSHYPIPEKRVARYALLDLAKLRASTQVSDDALRAYYNANLDEYQVENRVHCEHILFKTIGKTDAEIAEIRKTAEGVLQQAQHGAIFEELAKKYSEDDASKAKGGDLGWIVEGQTVPEFQQAAFSLPKGGLSGLVKTQYGFHIIKVLDHETARTKTFDEVRASILPLVLDQKVNAEANDIFDQMAAAVRESDRQPIDAFAAKFHLDLGETPPVSISDPLGPLGNSPDLHQTLFALHSGELSQPIQTDTGYVVLTVKDVIPAHQGTLAEVHDQALADYQREQSASLARSRAEDLAKRAQGGVNFDQAAKALGLTVKTSDFFARNSTVPDVGTGSQLSAAFHMPAGQVASPTQVEGNWLVYRLVDHQAANPDDFAKQKDGIARELRQTDQNAAFDAFHNALVDRLKQEGKLTINSEAVDRVIHQS